MFQTEIRVPFVQTHLWCQLKAFADVLLICTDGKHGLFTIYKKIPEIRVESKWNMTFLVVPAENFLEQRNI